MVEKIVNAARSLYCHVGEISLEKSYNIALDIPCISSIR
jgi:hypothetical protein